MKLLNALPCIGLLVVLAGCEDKEIKVYRVSKELTAGSQPVTAAASQPDSKSMESGPGEAAAPSATFEAPASWEGQPKSSMREASFLVKGENGAVADVSLIILKGSAGKTLDNVNRWLAQLGQPAITAERLNELAESVTTELGTVSVVDLEGLPDGADSAKDGRILAGIAAREGETWFFKMRGNAPLVKSEKEHFLSWVRSTRSANATAQAESRDPSAESPKPEIQWDAPKNWKTVPASQMRYASFLAEGASGEKADISVIMLGGQGGGDLENVNRWRSQIGLSPIDSGELASQVTRLGDGPSSISVVDLSGKGTRMLAGWLRKNNQSWFFKLVGPSTLVEGEKESFVGFLRSVKFNESAKDVAKTH